MKKVNLKGKLTLNKEAISKLDKSKMDNLKGGGPTFSLLCTTPALTRIYCTGGDPYQTVCCGTSVA